MNTSCQFLLLSYSYSVLHGIVQPAKLLLPEKVAVPFTFLAGRILKTAGKPRLVKQ